MVPPSSSSSDPTNNNNKNINNRMNMPHTGMGETPVVGSSSSSTVSLQPQDLKKQSSQHHNHSSSNDSLLWGSARSTTTTPRTSFSQSLPLSRTISTSTSTSYTTLPSAVSLGARPTTPTTPTNRRASASSNSVSWSWQLAQRSNGSCVKTILADLQQRQQQQSDVDQVEEKIMLLAQYALDSYYQVIIAKYQGIATILECMQAHPHHADLQGHGALCLARLTNKVQMVQGGAVSILLQAVQNHSSNIAVVSQALQGLDSILLYGTTTTTSVDRETQELLQTLFPELEQMYLTPQGRSSLQRLKQQFSA